MFGLSPIELMVIGGIALMLFGSRLPEVARSMGKSVVEFKRGLNGITDEIHGTASAATSYTPSSTRSSRAREDREEMAAPKFEPPPSEGAA